MTFMTYEERARIRARKTQFNAAAALFNMIGNAKAKNDADEVKDLNEKLSNSEEGVQASFVKIGKAVEDAAMQADLATKFLETTREVSQRNIPPVQAGIYASNRDFFDDALLIGFLIDSNKDKGPLKEIEEDVRAIVRFGTGDIEDKSNIKSWELETDEQYIIAKRPAYA